MPLTALSLFSGIEGLGLGIERAGLSDKIKVIQFVENNLYCQRILAKHYPSVPIHADIRDYHAKQGQFDIISGGFPCTEVSSAGKRTGLAGEHSGLWSEMFRLIQEVQPKAVLIENVANLINNGLYEITESLSSIGYDSRWQILSSAQHGGKFHVRKRLFIIGYPKLNQQLSHIHEKWDKCNSFAERLRMAKPMEMDTKSQWLCGQKNPAFDRRRSAHNSCNAPINNERAKRRRGRSYQSQQTRQQARKLTNSSSLGKYAQRRETKRRASLEKFLDGENCNSRQENSIRFLFHQRRGDSSIQSCEGSIWFGSTTDPCFDTPYPQSFGRHTSWSENTQARTNSTPECKIASIVKPSWRQTQPRVCRGIDGIPPWLHRALDNDIIPHRRERLTALGNSVDSDVAAIAWTQLYRFCFGGNDE